MQWLAKQERLRTWRDWLQEEGEEEEGGEDAWHNAQEKQPLLEGNQGGLVLPQAC